MKTFRTSAGPFSERPHFEPAEIDRTCVEQLRKVGLYPSAPEPIRIDRFIEKRFGIVPSYDDLPDGVLGFTEFSEKGVKAIVISRALADEDGKPAERRVRSTLAHEAGHGFLHAHLFAMAQPKTNLFERDACQGRQILCREVLGSPQQAAVRPKSTWSEFQANRTIGGLLLPRGLVAAALKPMMVSSGGLGGTILEPEKFSDAAALLSEIFDVNPVVAQYRLEDLYRLEKNGQMML
jgi:hypothetical protein